MLRACSAHARSKKEQQNGRIEPLPLASSVSVLLSVLTVLLPPNKVESLPEITFVGLFGRDWRNIYFFFQNLPFRLFSVASGINFGQVAQEEREEEEVQKELNLPAEFAASGLPESKLFWQFSAPQGTSHGHAWSMKSFGIELDVIGWDIITHVVPGIWCQVRMLRARTAHALGKKEQQNGRIEPLPLALSISDLLSVLTVLLPPDKVESLSWITFIGGFGDVWRIIFPNLSFQRLCSRASSESTTCKRN